MSSLADDTEASVGAVAHLCIASGWPKMLALTFCW